MKQKMYGIFFMLLYSTYTIATQPKPAKSIKVADMKVLKDALKAVQPGDSIIMANGIWKDADIVFTANGEKDNYIYLVAETPGKVFIEGTSSLRLSGQWLYVSGLIFKNGYSPRKSVIEFRKDSRNLAYNCVVSNCVIDNFNQPSKDVSEYWVNIHGKNNKLQYCYIAGKTGLGTAVVIWPTDSTTNNGHKLYRNYFGPRPRLGANGGETIRIGTSSVSHLTSGSVVDGNYFEHCNGETEIISSKSGGNTFTNNTFYECEGSLVLRHGNNAVVSGNWFIGNGKPYTGGIRVVNQGHKIFNNYFYKLRGDEFRSALSIMDGIPNTPAYGYLQVKNVIVANNTYYDCAYPMALGVGYGYGVGYQGADRIMPPQNVLFTNNIVYCPGTKELMKYYDAHADVKFDNNLFYNNGGLFLEKGSINAKVQKGKAFNFNTIYSTSLAKPLDFVQTDIIGKTRKKAVIGAFQENGGNTVVEPATAANCGPKWYKPQSPAYQTGQNRLIPISSTEKDGLLKAMRNAQNGDVFLLSKGTHIITDRITVSKNVTIKSNDAAAKPVISLASAKSNNSFFELKGNARLSLNGINVDGKASKPNLPAQYIFVTAQNDALGYAIFLNHCVLSNIVIDNGAIYKACKNTLADTISIVNSYLYNAPTGLSLSEETDNVGKYNADHIIIQNSVFSNFSNTAIDYYRGGFDESTLGGLLKIDHCVFNKIGAKSNKPTIHLTGIANVMISNSVFSNSPASINQLSGNKNIVQNTNFYQTSKPGLATGAIEKKLFFINPQLDANWKTKAIKLKGKATDGGNIGLKN